MDKNISLWRSIFPYGFLVFSYGFLLSSNAFRRCSYVFPWFAYVFFPPSIIVKYWKSNFPHGDPPSPPRVPMVLSQLNSDVVGAQLRCELQGTLEQAFWMHERDPRERGLDHACLDSVRTLPIWTLSLGELRAGKQGL